MSYAIIEASVQNAAPVWLYEFIHMALHQRTDRADARHAHMGTIARIAHGHITDRRHGAAGRHAHLPAH